MPGMGINKATIPLHLETMPLMILTMEIGTARNNKITTTIITTTIIMVVLLVILIQGVLVV